MKKAIIYVFSGTGNTRLVANKIAEELINQGINTTVFDVRKPILDVPNPNQYDIALFGYPIHAFNTPKFFLDFIKQLPRVKEMSTYIFKTSGEPFHINNASSFSLVRKLKKHGFIEIASTKDNLELLVIDALFTTEKMFNKHRNQFITKTIHRS